MPLRPTNDIERSALKTTFRMLLKLVGGQEAAENFTRGRHQTLNRYGNEKEPDCHAPIDVILDLERVHGQPLVTKLLADMAGYLLVKKVEQAGTSDMLAHLSAVAKESGDVLTVLSGVVSGEADSEESLRKLVKEAREGREAYAAVEEAARVRLEQVQGRGRVVAVKVA
jgi:hypothetical protein